MNSGMGPLLLSMVLNAIKFSSLPIITWKNTETDGEQYLSCLLQIYSDEPRTVTKETGLTFYRHHFTIRNVTEQCRKKQMVMENTVLGYLTTVYGHSNQCNGPEVYQEYLADLGYYKPLMIVLKRSLSLFDAILLHGCL